MISFSLKRFRVESVIGSFGKSVFLTLTTPDKCSYAEIRLRWRKFRHDYFRAVRGRPKYLMVYEPHPHGHGWHIHIVIESGFLPLAQIRRFSSAAGFGRVHIEKTYGSKCALYLGKYLTKALASAKTLGVRRVRLVNLSRGLTRLCDISVDSPYRDFIKSVVNRADWFSLGLGFHPAIDHYRFVYAYFLFGRIYYDGWYAPLLDMIISDCLLQFGL